MNPTRTRVSALLVLTLLTASACSGGDAGPTEPVTQDPPGTITTSGGTVAATGGAATVTIPAGALSTKTQITVTAMTSPPTDPNLVGGTAYSFGPTGTQFSAPVQMTLRYSATAVPDGLPESALYIAKNVGGKWERISGTMSVDSTAKTVTGSVSSFSDYAVLADPCAARHITPGQVVSRQLRAGACVFGAATATPQLEDLYEFRISQTTALHLTMTATGFRPTMGIKEKAANIDAGVVYAFRNPAEGATETRVEVILAPGTYHLWAGNRDGLGTGNYQLRMDLVSGDNKNGCRAYFVRPPIDMQQEISGTSDCIVAITVTPDPAFLGKQIAEEYYAVKVLAGQTLRVTGTRVSGEAGFAPFPTIFLPGGGAAQDATATGTSARTAQHTATADGYYLVGVSSIFNAHPSQGGRYTQGTYRLQMTLQ